MKFRLSGKIYYAVGSCHDDRSIEINERFKAPDIKTAITRAREIIKQDLDKYKHLTDFGLEVVLEVTKPIWKIEFVDEQTAMPAQSARPAVKAYLKERRIK